MNKAAFSIKKYQFDKVNIDLSNYVPDNTEFDFEPKGVFNKENSTFELTFIFFAFNKDNKDNPFVKVQCVGEFVFDNVDSFDDIPSFFYRNSIAILFPFVRAFVSMVTIQANVLPIMLPTMNLSSLEEPLRNNTSQI
jgi:preprotein translocase subunit SecB